jgi:hypothetical protein
VAAPDPWRLPSGRPGETLQKGGGEGETEWPNASRNRHGLVPVSPPDGLPGKACPYDKCLTFPCFLALPCREIYSPPINNAPASEIAPGLSTYPWSLVP